jgi:two-component system sensor histidine kinase EvgS
MNESLKVSKEKAEESERLKTAFLNNITHEIRTPLNAVVGFSNIINDLDLSADKIKSFTKTISESSNQLLSIVDDVLEIALIQANSSSVINTEFDIVNLVNSLLSEFKVRLTNKDVEFKSGINTSFDKYLIYSDKTKISAILKHLLDNSRKFTIQGTILFNMDIESDNLILEIADTGIGISQDLQEIIFEPFRQVEAGNSRKFGGNGIGLAIVKANVDMLKGKIDLTSELNVGTSIKVTIPFKPVSKQPEKQFKNDIHNYTFKTILIAEDEYSNFFYLSELLADTKANILYASNGQEAIDLFKDESHIDLILMDLKMPVMDGLTAAKQIKKINSKIPIIAQTAYLLNNSDESGNDFGLDEVINKPIKKDLLFDILNKYLNI